MARMKVKRSKKSPSVRALKREIERLTRLLDTKETSLTDLESAARLNEDTINQSRADLQTKIDEMAALTERATSAETLASIGDESYKRLEGELAAAKRAKVVVDEQLKTTQRLHGECHIEAEERFNSLKRFTQLLTVMLAEALTSDLLMQEVIKLSREAGIKFEVNEDIKSIMRKAYAARAEISTNRASDAMKLAETNGLPKDLLDELDRVGESLGLGKFPRPKQR